MSDIVALTAGIGGFTLLIIVASCLGSVAITALAIVLVRRMFAPDRSVLEKGLSGQATILKIWQTGVSINDQPQVGMALEVRIPGREVYQTETKMIIPIIHIPKFQPGAVVPVKVDASNPHKVVPDVYA